MEIEDLRKKTWFHCALDGQPLMLVQGKYSFYYCCLKYFLENRKFGEISCKNRLSIHSADLIFAKLEWEMEDDNLKPGLEFKIPGAEIKVLQVEQDEVHLSVLNTKTTKMRMEEALYDKNDV